jgi:hypothetical protein
LHNGPLNCQISKNVFDTIFNSAIVVGKNPNKLPSNVVSSNNYFTQVGNGAEQSLMGVNDTTMSRTSYPIIEFVSLGNITTNDYFNRKHEANTATSSSSFFYNALVKGPTNLQDQAAISVAMPASTITNIVNFPITNTEQFIDVKYQMSNSYLSRKGTVSLNIRGDTTAENVASISDTYTYTEDQTAYSPSTSLLTASNGSSYDSLVIDAPVNSSLNNILTTLSTTIDAGNSTLYITGSAKFVGLASYLIAVFSITSSTFQLLTQSASPQFNYDTTLNPAERWTLLSADTPVFGATVHTTSNYITLYCDTNSASSGALFDVTYQTNIFQK